MPMYAFCKNGKKKLYKGKRKLVKLIHNLQSTFKRFPSRISLMVSAKAKLKADRCYLLNTVSVLRDC